jgi:ADP-ribose pyrophosphatase YjhB (NUDIX family)
MTSPIRFCQHCGGSLSHLSVEGKSRPHCPACGHIVFLDPKLAAVVLVAQEKYLLMVRRGVEPALGRWAFPSGYVDRGEAVEDAAMREVEEETGLVVRLSRFVGLYSGTGSHVVLAVYGAVVAGGSLRPGGDTQEVNWFRVADLPPLPFPHDDRILRDWLRLQAGE